MISIMSNWIQIFERAAIRDLETGDVLFRRDDPVQSMFFVRTGEIALERALSDGGHLILHVATSGTALAEASLFAEHYHCDAVARCKTRLAVMSRSAFAEALGQRSGAAMSLIETHAKTIQAQRARIEILRLRRVSDRLDAWLELYGEPRKGEWIAIAEQIGVSAPALYRELAKRR